MGYVAGLGENVIELCGPRVGKKRKPPRIPEKGSPLRSGGLEGWGQAFVWPGGVRARFPADGPNWLGGARRGDQEPRQVSTHPEGDGLFGTAGLEKGGGVPGPQTTYLPDPASQSPHLLAHPSLARGLPSSAGRVGQGGAVQTEPFPQFFPFSASRSRVLGEGCFQSPPELTPPTKPQPRLPTFGSQSA